MQKTKQVFIILLFFITTLLHGYESQEKLQVMLTGTIAQFIFWKDEEQKEFILGVYKSPTVSLFEDIYKSRFIDERKVKIVDLKSIEALEKTEKIDILFIGEILNGELEMLLELIESKHTVTISDMRGFAQKGGMLQLYEKNQKLKIRVNFEKVQEENIKIKSSLLRICEIFPKRSL